MSPFGREAGLILRTFFLADLFGPNRVSENTREALSEQGRGACHENRGRVFG